MGTSLNLMRTVSPLHVYSEGMGKPSGYEDPGAAVEMHPSINDLVEPSSMVIWKVRG